jgi:hypothetical protein
MYTDMLFSGKIPRGSLHPTSCLMQIKYRAVRRWYRHAVTSNFLEVCRVAESLRELIVSLITVAHMPQIEEIYNSLKNKKIIQLKQVPHRPILAKATK